MRVLARSAGVSPISEERILLISSTHLADRGDLGQHRVIELQRRHLTRRIDLEIGLASILAAAQVDLDLWHFEPLLRHEHADHARVGSDGIVEFHCSLLPIFHSPLP
jgi:hypothetical protein